MQAAAGRGWQKSRIVSVRVRVSEVKGPDMGFTVRGTTAGRFPVKTYPLQSSLAQTDSSSNHRPARAAMLLGRKGIRLTFRLPAWERK